MSRGRLASRSPLTLGIAAVLLWALTACGGKAHSDGVGQTAGTGAGQSGSAGSGSGVAASGNGGSGSVEEPQPPVAFDDSFPWFNSVGDGDFPSGQHDEVLHIVASGAPARSTLSTHNIYDLFSYAEALQFSARSSAPTRLLVSASHVIQAYDYFEARDAGMQWPIAAVEVGLEWQDFSIPLSEMKPPEPSGSAGLPSFFLAFIVEHPEPVEVWLDDVHIKPKPLK